MSNIRQSRSKNNEFDVFLEKISQNYPKNEIEKQRKLFIYIRDKVFKTKEEIGYEMENFMKLSGYSYKCNLKIGDEHNLTFVCCCASKKKIMTKTKNCSNDDEEDDFDEDEEDENKITKYENKNKNKTMIGNLTKNQNKANGGLVKRENEEACNFRFVFKGKCMFYKLIKAINHNHSANIDEVIIIYYIFIYRNFLLGQKISNSPYLLFPF